MHSLFHYMIDIREDNTELILGLHQEDELDSGVKCTRPYLDIGEAFDSRSDSLALRKGAVQILRAP